MRAATRVFPPLQVRIGETLRVVFGVALAVLLAACGSGPPPPIVPSLAVRVMPAVATVLAAQTQQFTATVTGSVNEAVTWSVNGAAGGNSSVGSISATGLYTAPVIAPSQGAVTVTATSQADNSVSASAVVTITPVVLVAISPASAAVGATQSLQLTAAITGSSNQSVIWSLTGASGGGSAGSISPQGLYTAPRIPPIPNGVTVTATSRADAKASASAQITIVPKVVEFSTLPSSIETNLSTFLVSGTAPPGSQATVNGANVTLDTSGNFAMPVALNPGLNRIELIIHSPQNGTSDAVKTVNFDSNFSTANTRLLYVSSVNSNLAGTIVLDVDNDIILGFIPNEHVRGISPDGTKTYMDDRSVISTATHQALAPLAFIGDIPSNGFVVSPDGARLYSGTQVLDVATNQLLLNALPTSIETGSTYSGPPQGGPAISPDGKSIYCGEPCGFGGVSVISTSSGSIAPESIIIPGFLSDIAVTPDGKRLLVTSYAYALGRADIFDVSSLNELAFVALPDFAGQIVVSTDGKKAVFGAAGNPTYGQGGITVFDLKSFNVDSRVSIDLADHLAISDLDQVFVSSGDTPGVDEYALLTNGTLSPLAYFDLGINQFVEGFFEPTVDDIEKMVFKP